jgi:glycosyltransferase involved in cell wall biosynthesis
MKKLLYVCEVDSGGITEYSILQCEALAKAGVSVFFLCKSSFPKERLSPVVKIIEFEPLEPPRFTFRKLKTIWRMTLGLNYYSQQIRRLAEEGQFDFLLFAFYKEYFAPFWIGPLKKLKNNGCLMGTIAHDPVRDFEIGPKWWHRFCVRKAFSILTDVFVHDDTPVDFGGKRPEGIAVHKIPHGPYEVAEPIIGRLEMRRRFGFSSDLTTAGKAGALEEEQSMVGPKGEGGGSTESKVEARPCFDKPSCASQLGSLAGGLADASVSESLTRSASVSASLPATSHSPLATPASTDVVFLAFGQIRDGKNLDLFIEAMTLLPKNVKLLVAGKGDSSTSRPPEYYQKLAHDFGVAERCRWDIRRIPDEEVGDIFECCDAVLLTYSAKFRSASGVLNAAVTAKKLVLASSGYGPLKTVVEKYNLGVFVEPDNKNEILKGANKLLDYFSPPFTHYQSQYTETSFKPEWQKYEEENSWHLNAQLVSSALFSKQ